MLYTSGSEGIERRANYCRHCRHVNFAHSLLRKLHSRAVPQGLLLEMLELREVKVSRGVLRGERGREASDLPDRYRGERLVRKEEFIAPGVPTALIERRGLSPCPEATNLVCAEIEKDGRKHLLIPEAAAAWKQLRPSAQKEGIEIYIVSAYRSIFRQAEIIRSKILAGQSIEKILMVCAPPGYSEHHSGRAVDLATPGVKRLELDFENSAAFRWLHENAQNFGYTLSYPRGNSKGYAYEPWHWCYSFT